MIDYIGKKKMSKRCFDQTFTHFIWKGYLDETSRYMWFVAHFSDEKRRRALVAKEWVCWKAALSRYDALLEHIWECGYQESDGYVGLIAGGHSYEKWIDRAYFVREDIWMGRAYSGNIEGLLDVEEYTDAIANGCMHPDKSVAHVKSIIDQLPQISHCIWVHYAFVLHRLDVLEQLFADFRAPDLMHCVRVTEIPLMQWMLDHGYLWDSVPIDEKATPAQLEFALNNGWSPNVYSLMRGFANNKESLEWLMKKMSKRCFDQTFKNIIWKGYLDETSRYMWFVAHFRNKKRRKQLVAKEWVCWKAALSGNDIILEHIWKCGYKGEKGYMGLIAGGHVGPFAKWNERIKFSYHSIWIGSAYLGDFDLFECNGLSVLRSAAFDGCMHPDKHWSHTKTVMEKLPAINLAQWISGAFRRCRLDVLENLFSDFKTANWPVVEVTEVPLMQWMLDRGGTWALAQRNPDKHTINNKATPEQLEFAFTHGWSPNMNFLRSNFANNKESLEWLKEKFCIYLSALMILKKSSSCSSASSIPQCVCGN